MAETGISTLQNLVLAGNTVVECIDSNETEPLAFSTLIAFPSLRFTDFAFLD